MRIGEGITFSGLDGLGHFHGRTAQEKTYKIIHHWLKTVKTGTPQDVADLYDEKAVLMGTVAKHLKQGRSVIKTYFDTFLRKHPVGALNSIIFQELGGDHAVADGNYTFELDGGDGGRILVPARFTFVVDLHSGLILTHHSSSTPEGQTTSI